jgi:sulfur-oxidizing protein SoxX
MTTRVFGKMVLIVVGAMLAASVGAEGLVKYTVDTKKMEIADSLTGKPGDPENGKAVAIDRRKGNCLACHQMPIPEQAFHGAIAPPLMGVGARYTPAQLRLRVVDAKMFNPRTIMPGFYKVDGIHRPLEKFEGKPILSAQEVEDVIAYLETIK